MNSLRLILRLLPMCWLLGAKSTVLGQAGGVDSTFDIGFLGNANFGSVRVIAPAGADKVLIAGDNLRAVDGFRTDGVARLNSDGTIDRSFACRLEGPFGFTVNASFTQSDGKIIIGGVFRRVHGIERWHLARLSHDGSLDTSFNPNVGPIQAMAQQQDTKLIVAVDAPDPQHPLRSRILRLNVDGSLDQTFASADTEFAVNALAVQNDGMILLAGYFVRVNGIPRERIARLRNDGTLDAGFQAGADWYVHGVVVQSDGKIILGGEFNNVNGTGRSRIARLHPDGTLDVDFAPAADGAVFGLLAQADGRILVGGAFTLLSGVARNRIGRLNRDGTIEMAFDPGSGADAAIYSFHAQNDGKILIGGSFSSLSGSPRNRIARLDPDGRLDAVFHPMPLGIGALDSVAVQSDDKLLLGGVFTSVAGFPRSNIARVNADGSIDPAFDPNEGTDAGVSVLALQSDNKVIIGGSFTRVNRTDRMYVARLNSDGTLDSTFNAGSLPDLVSAVAIQSDGKVVIASGGGRYLLRLNRDGSLDQSFDPGRQGSSYRGLALQNDGKLLAGINGSIRAPGVVRFNVDGSLDSGFRFGAGSPSPFMASVDSMALQTDGKILIGGFVVGGVTGGVADLARLNSDGSYDSTFAPLTTGGGVNSLALQKDGKILIGGLFVITRLNPDGTLDGTFDPGSGPDGEVRSVALQRDGRIAVAGSFMHMNRILRTGLARLNGDALRVTSWLMNSDRQFQLRVSDVTNATYVIEASTNLVNWSPVTTNQTASSESIDTDTGLHSARFYRARLQ